MVVTFLSLHHFITHTATTILTKFFIFNNKLCFTISFRRLFVTFLALYLCVGVFSPPFACNALLLFGKKDAKEKTATGNKTGKKKKSGKRSITDLPPTQFDCKNLAFFCSQINCSPIAHITKSLPTESIFAGGDICMKTDQSACKLKKPDMPLWKGDGFVLQCINDKWELVDTPMIALAIRDKLLTMLILRFEGKRWTVYQEFNSQQKQMQNEVQFDTPMQETQMKIRQQQYSGIKEAEKDGTLDNQISNEQKELAQLEQEEENLRRRRRRMRQLSGLAEQSASMEATEEIITAGELRHAQPCAEARDLCSKDLKSCVYDKTFYPYLKVTKNKEDFIHLRKCQDGGNIGTLECSTILCTNAGGVDNQAKPTPAIIKCEEKAPLQVHMVYYHPSQQRWCLSKFDSSSTQTIGKTGQSMGQTLEESLTEQGVDKGDIAYIKNSVYSPEVVKGFFMFGDALKKIQAAPSYKLYEEKGLTNFANNRRFFKDPKFAPEIKPEVLYFRKCPMQRNPKCDEMWITPWDILQLMIKNKDITDGVTPPLAKRDEEQKEEKRMKEGESARAEEKDKKLEKEEEGEITQDKEKKEEEAAAKSAVVSIHNYNRRLKSFLMLFTTVVAVGISLTAIFVYLPAN